MNHRKESTVIKAIEVQLRSQSLVLENLKKNQPIQIMWVSKKKAAELYGVGERTIYNWATDGMIQTKKICDRTYYSVAPLVKF